MLLIAVVCHVVVFIYRKCIELMLFTNVNLAGTSEALVAFERSLALAIHSQGILLYALLILGTLHCLRRCHGLRLSHIGWHFHFDRKCWADAVCIGLGWGATTFFSMKWIMDGLPPGWRYTGHVGTPVFDVLVLSIVYAGTIPAVAEEVFFRGFSYAILKRDTGRTAGILLSSALFAVWHIHAFQTPILALPLFLGGVVFCVQYEKCHSLVPPIITHSISNLTVAILSNVRAG